MVREELFVTIKDKEEKVAEAQLTIKDEEEEVVEKEVVEEEVVEEEVVDVYSLKGKWVVGTLPDGYLRSNPLPQVPTRQRLPIGNSLPPYLGISPLGIPNLHRIGQAIARVAGAQIIGS